MNRAMKWRSLAERTDSIGHRGTYRTFTLSRTRAMQWPLGMHSWGLLSPSTQKTTWPSWQGMPRRKPLAQVTQNALAPFALKSSRTRAFAHSNSASSPLLLSQHSIVQWRTSVPNRVGGATMSEHNSHRIPGRGFSRNGLSKSESSVCNCHTSKIQTCSLLYQVYLRKRRNKCSYLLSLDTIEQFRPALITSVPRCPCLAVWAERDDAALVLLMSSSDNFRTANTVRDVACAKRWTKSCIQTGIYQRNLKARHTFAADFGIVLSVTQYAPARTKITHTCMTHQNSERTRETSKKSQLNICAKNRLLNTTIYLGEMADPARLNLSLSDGAADSLIVSRLAES